MKKLLFGLLLLLSAFACEPDEVPSYVGTWRIVSSEPDLGVAYADSYMTLDRQWNYTIYDAPTGQTFSGSGQDFSWEKMVITLKVVNEEETRTYTAELQYLKRDRMIVKTSSVNGIETVIELTRVPRSA